MSNSVQKIAIVGAGGQQGKFIAEELVKLGRQTITALTRADSTSSLPEGVEVKTVDYNDPSSLVSALRGQDVLIITMAVTAPPGTQDKLIDAAVEAGVKFIIPNEYAYDYERVPGFAEEIIVGEAITKARKKIESTGVPFIGINCGFWYDYSLGNGPFLFGFDIKNKVYQKIDEGNVKLSSSTWKQVARGVAALLNLKISPDDNNDKSPTLSDFKNKSVCIQSFHVSQNDMFESLKRVTNTTDADWRIEQENSQERYKRGIELLQTGDRGGLGIAMYTRCFFPDGASTMVNLQNDLFGLPEEDLDESTKSAVDRAMTLPAFGSA